MWFNRLFCVFLGLLSENANREKFLTRRGYMPPYGGGVLSPYVQSIYMIATTNTIAITHKYFEFKNDWLIIIHIRYSCT